MYDVDFAEVSANGQSSATTESMYAYGELEVTSEADFVMDVQTALNGTGTRITQEELLLIDPAEWENFLAGLLGFVNTSTGSDQNSYYEDYSNEAPLGEYFIEQWGWLPSIRQMPGYHFYDYLYQGLDSEYLNMAYAAHMGADAFRDAGVSLSSIANVPFQVYYQGMLMTVTWHPGTLSTTNGGQDPNNGNDIVVTANLGYFTVHSEQAGGAAATGEPPPTGVDLMQLDEQTATYVRFVDQALKYLAQDPLALQLLKDAHDAGVKIKIVTGAVKSGFEIKTNTVHWNPGMALRLTNNGVMSPAMVLLHELAHGLLNLHGSDSQYHTAEDRYIIENYERIVGRRLGEPIREDHLGEAVFGIGSVTYHTPPPGS